MSISVITAVSILIVCRVHGYESAENEDLQTSQVQKYSDLNSEDTFLEPTRQQYNQETTLPSLKVERDDSAFTPALAVNPNNIVRHPQNFARQIGSPFSSTNSISGSSFSGHGLDQSGGGGGSFGSFGSHGGGVNSGIGGGGGYSYSGGSSNFGGSSFGHGSSVPSFGGGGGGYSGGHGGGGGGGGGFSSGGGYGGGSDGGYHNLPPIIHKSVYVHVAPPEEEVPKQRVIIPKVAPKKNYQIVFIKAPTPPPPSVPIIPPFPPQSDKTLIYVLHPKPEEAPPIHIPAPPPNLPVKPEVYFIRYKTKKEEGHGVVGDGGGYHRRYGRDEDVEEEESPDATDANGKTVPPESDVPVNQYEEEQNDSSGESSNIVRNAH